MTFSILARDPGTGALGGAAATGSLCVGGWVLRGDSRAGLSASQGAAPSTLWGEAALDAMRGGLPAPDTVARVTADDAGRDWRQLAALDARGRHGAFTGARNTPWRGALGGDGVIACGNLLAGEGVLRAALDALGTAPGALADRLLAALRAGAAAGGDTRGLMSAALLVVAEDMPPLTLRIDWADDPIDALGRLLERSRAPDYADWLPCVPNRANPQRYPQDDAAREK